MRVFKILFFSVFICGYVGAQPVVGVGDIKVGMTEMDFLQVSDIKSKSIQDFSGKKGDFFSIVWKRNSDSGNSAFGDKIYSKEYIKYYFKLETGVINHRGSDIYDVVANFYKGELISIDINVGVSANDFVTILSEKYGKPNFIDETKKSVCQNSYGAKTEHNDGSRYWNWGGGNHIVASIGMFAGDCGKNFASTYSIKNIEKSNLIFNIEKNLAEDFKKSETKAKASSSRL